MMAGFQPLNDPDIPQFAPDCRHTARDDRGVSSSSSDIWKGRFIMLKQSLAACAFIVGLAGAAFAQGAPAAGEGKGGPTDDCMKSAYDLADAAEKKQLPDASLEKLDGMFNTMEKHCKALELPQAQAMAAQIKTFIDGEKAQ